MVVVVRNILCPTNRANLLANSCRAISKSTNKTPFEQNHMKKITTITKTQPPLGLAGVSATELGTSMEIPRDCRGVSTVVVTSEARIVQRERRKPRQKDWKLRSRTKRNEYTRMGLSSLYLI